jgi:hypothetical protein
LERASRETDGVSAAFRTVVKIPNRIIAVNFLYFVIVGVVKRTLAYKRSRVCAELLNFTRLGRPREQLALTD